MNRRDFLFRTAGWLSLMGGDWGRLWSMPVSRRRNSLLVLVRIPGGLDATLGLDPLEMPADCTEKDLFLEYRPDEIQVSGQIKVGPAALPLLPHLTDCLVLNGVMMRRDAGHPACLDYISNGRGDGTAPAIPVTTSLAFPPSPFGVVFNEGTYTAGKAALLSSLKDLKAESEGGNLYATVEEELKYFLPQDSPLETAEEALIAAKESAERFQKLLLDFAATYGPLDDIHLTTAALASGGSRFAQLDLNANGALLDTHSAHAENHLREQRARWSEVARLFSIFKKTPFEQGSLFDATTFVVITEFSRTPYLNSAKGKDHNPLTNSVLIAGRGIQKGRVIGASRMIPEKKSKTGRAEHYARPIRYATGELADSPNGASFIYPENIARTLASLFGSPNGFGYIDDKFAVIPGVLR